MFTRTHQKYVTYTYASIINYTEDNNEIELLSESDYVIYRIGEYFVCGRKWIYIYMCQIKSNYELIYKK